MLSNIKQKQFKLVSQGQFPSHKKGEPQLMSHQKWSWMTLSKKENSNQCSATSKTHTTGKDALGTSHTSLACTRWSHSPQGTLNLDHTSACLSVPNSLLPGAGLRLSGTLPLRAPGWNVPWQLPGLREGAASGWGQPVTGTDSRLACQSCYSKRVCVPDTQWSQTVPRAGVWSRVHCRLMQEGSSRPQTLQRVSAKHS